VNANGAAAFVWVCGTCGAHQIQTRTRSPAGALSPVRNLSPRGQEVHDPQVGIDHSGGTVFAWDRFHSEDPDPDPEYSCCFRIDGRARTAGGTLSPIQEISPAGTEAVWPDIAVDADGDAVFIWDRNGAEVRARSAAGALGAIRTLSPAGRWVYRPQVAVNASGDAAATWVAFSSSNNPLFQGAVGP
jgi:hypothetical protein